MKQESTKKSRLWLWLVIAAAALVAAGGVLLALLLPGAQSDPNGDSSQTPELYWNLDREQFIEESTGMSTRTKSEDGLYHMCFAYQGQQVDLAVMDKQLVNYIDTMDAVGLVVDADGIVIDAAEPQSFLTVIAKEYYIRKVEGDTLTVNSSQAMNGMELSVSLSDATGIYDVSAEAQVRGASAEMSLMDTLIIYGDAENNASHIYIVRHPVNADVYWRVDRYWDAENLCTTRVPDENGVYTIRFAIHGEQVDLKCRDYTFVNHLDSLGLTVCQVALLFDEEGYIVDNTDIALALRGKYLCQYYNVTDIEGDQITVERVQPGSEQGLVKTFTLGDDCEIVMCCSGCYESHVGEHTDHLRVGDTVNVYTDLDGIGKLIFISMRPAESKLYYNMEQKYNSVTKETRREPVNGWYIFDKMFCDGKTVTLKTKDKKLANEVESQLAMGLELEGNVIVRTYPTRCATGSNTTANNKYVTSVMGTIFTAAAAGDPTQVNAIMSQDCQVYDMTGDFGVPKGSKTTLKANDRIYAYADYRGLITHVFVNFRYAEGTSVYYNVNRQYDTKNETTKRVPDADGYYVFEMIKDGKTVTVKTKNKTMATFIDAQSAPTVALRVSGGIIKEAHLVHMAVKYGNKVDNYVYVDKVNKDRTYTTYYYSGEQKVAGAVARKLAKNCKIYNVSAAYVSYRGEITTLKPGDRIQAITSRETDEVIMLFVLSRDVDSPMYYHVKRQYDTTKSETRRVPNEEGWYVFDLAVNGGIKQFRTKDKTIASEVDQFSAPFVMITDGDVILRAFNATLHKDVKANAAGQYDVMSIDGSKVTLTRNRPLADNYGDTKELGLAKNYQVYDISSYASAFGAKTTLKVGDRVTCYADDDGNISFIFVNYANTRKAGHISYCDHCKKDVFWNPYTGEFYETDDHYYLPCDIDTGKGKTIGEKKAYSICLDLNGHSFSTKARPFLVYSELSILDSAGGGSIVGQCTYQNGLGGCINVARGGKLSLYGGTLTLQAGGITPGKGGVVNVGYEAVFNMYDGAVKGGYVTDQGGNIFVNGSTFNMYGGTVEGGTADLSGGNIATAANSTLNLLGGTIAGDTVIGAGSKVTVSGDLTVTAGAATGLTLSAGDVLTLGKLSEKASIVISADGVFTEAKENIADYQAFFKPFDADDTIEVQENTLAYVNIIDLNKIDNSDLVFAGGTTKAVCPVCEVEVTWTALTEKKANLVGGGHYYLTDHVTYEGGSNWHILAPDSGTACLHLNGKSLTSPTRVIQGNFGALNVMGNGTVTGNYTDSANPKRGAVMDTTPSKADCAEVTAINLLGGTYVAAEGNTQENIVSIWNNGGRIRMYAGATVKGGIYVGTSGILNSELSVCGGTVEGTVALAGSSKNTSTLNLSGGNIAAVTLPVNAVCNISGTPVVDAMQLAEGARLTLGELTEGASLTVSANGVFTNPTDLAESLLPFFRTAAEGDTITVEENALIYTPAPQPVNPYAGELALDENGYAVCPVCGGDPVKWTAIYGSSVANGRVGDGKTGHYYLSENVSLSGAVQNVATAKTGSTLCLHLNGKNMTYGSRIAVAYDNSTINIMGSGNVKAIAFTATAANNNAPLYVYKNGTLNLYGGTYTTTDTTRPMLLLNHADGAVNIYEDVTVSGGIQAMKGTVTLYGNASADLITVEAAAKLVLSQDWTGTAKVETKEQ